MYYQRISLDLKPRTVENLKRRVACCLRDEDVIFKKENGKIK